MSCSPPPRCGKGAEAPLKNAPLQHLFHNVLVQIEVHLSLLYALNRSNSKTVPNFLGRDNLSIFIPSSLNERFVCIRKVNFMAEGQQREYRHSSFANLHPVFGANIHFFQEIPRWAVNRLSRPLLAELSQIQIDIVPPQNYIYVAFDRKNRSPRRKKP